MTFSEMLKNDMDDAILGNSEFEESIEYEVSGSTTPTTINAIVDREQTDQAGSDSGRSLRQQAKIIISKTDIATVTVKVDLVQMADNEGTVKTWRVVSIINSAAGSWQLLLTK